MPIADYTIRLERPEDYRAVEELTAKHFGTCINPAVTSTTSHT